LRSDVLFNVPVGFGINFKKNTIFFTWNCAIVLETNENMFGQKLLNLKALHAQIGIRLKAETDIDVMPFVNFGSEDFAFDILAYQRENSSTDEEPAQEILSLYSSVSKLLFFCFNNNYNRTLPYLVI
jgi:hypothetical protein